MEHRWGNRVPADIEVQIFVDPASTAWARLRDISVSGGFLETALKIPTLSTLRVNAPCTRTESVRVVRAIAIRSDAAGVGVEWFDDDFEVEQEAAIIKISATLSGVKIFAFMVVGLS